MKILFTLLIFVQIYVFLGVNTFASTYVSNASVADINRMSLYPNLNLNLEQASYYNDGSLECADVLPDSILGLFGGILEVENASRICFHPNGILKVAEVRGAFHVFKLGQLIQVDIESFEQIILSETEEVLSLYVEHSIPYTIVDQEVMVRGQLYFHEQNGEALRYAEELRDEFGFDFPQGVVFEMNEVVFYEDGGVRYADFSADSNRFSFIQGKAKLQGRAEFFESGRVKKATVGEESGPFEFRNGYVEKLVSIELYQNGRFKKIVTSGVGTNFFEVAGARIELWGDASFYQNGQLKRAYVAGKVKFKVVSSILVVNGSEDTRPIYFHEGGQFRKAIIDEDVSIFFNDRKVTARAGEWIEVAASGQYVGAHLKKEQSFSLKIGKTVKCSANYVELFAVGYLKSCIPLADDGFESRLLQSGNWKGQSAPVKFNRSGHFIAGDLAEPVGIRGFNAEITSDFKATEDEVMLSGKIKGVMPLKIQSIAVMFGHPDFFVDFEFLSKHKFRPKRARLAQDISLRTKNGVVAFNKGVYVCFDEDQLASHCF